MAISPTAPCAVRGVSCFCAATQAAAGELQTSHVGETQQGPEAPKVIPVIPTAQKTSGPGLGIKWT